MRAVGLFIACAAVVLLGGCLQASPQSGPCIADPDCGEDGVCTRLGECVAAEDAIAVRITWTIAGTHPTPAAPEACAGIDHLVVAFSDLDTDDTHSFSPVPCDAGQIYFDTMPPTLDQVQVTAFDAAGFSIAYQVRDLSGQPSANLAVDLTP
ncbi:MAG TPA: hypothetical protein VFG83_00545 [Kofleriaceae bacterium]|nr:hypothetical protein [Kofleriaceae bacterium]